MQVHKLSRPASTFLRLLLSAGLLGRGPKRLSVATTVEHGLRARLTIILSTISLNNFQVQSFWVENSFSKTHLLFTPRSPLGHTRPVSYTHLDVYKRQHTHKIYRYHALQPNNILNEQLHYRSHILLSLIHIYTV